MKSGTDTSEINVVPVEKLIGLGDRVREAAVDPSDAPANCSKSAGDPMAVLGAFDALRI